MSTNCLVTKLKEEVNNSNLPILNGLVFENTQSTPTNSGANRINFPVPASGVGAVVGTIESLDGTPCLYYYKENPTESDLKVKLTVEYTEDIPSHLYIGVSGKHKVVFKNKYDLVGIYRYGDLELSNAGDVTTGKDITLNVDDLAYAENLIALVGQFNVTGNIASLKNKSLYRVYLNRSSSPNDGSMTGNLIDFLNSVTFDPSGAGDLVLSFYTNLIGDGNDWVTQQPNIKRFSIYGCRGISNLTLEKIQSKLPNLKELIVRDTLITGRINNLALPLTQLGIAATDIDGSLDAFVLTQYNTVQRESGKCTNGNTWGNKITFKNSDGVDTPITAFGNHGGLNNALVTGNVKWRISSTPSAIDIGLFWTENPGSSSEEDHFYTGITIGTDGTFIEPLEIW